MQTPAYNIKIGSGTFARETKYDALRIGIECDINVPLDEFGVTLPANDRSVAIRKDDRVTVDLGYKDSLTRVFTGTVDAIEPGQGLVRVRGYSPAMPLTRARVHQVYEKQTVEGIVSALADKAGVEIETKRTGITLPCYVADNALTVYEHMKWLADLAGFDLYVKTDGKAVFGPYQEQGPVKLKYGEDIIDLRASFHRPRATNIIVSGENPSSARGTDNWHWLSKKGTTAPSGSGAVTCSLESPVIRDKTAADMIAKSVKESLSITTEGYVKMLGNPAVAVGGTVDIQGWPDSQMNGKRKVISVSHVYSLDEGFVTVAGWVQQSK